VELFSPHPIFFVEFIPHVWEVLLVAASDQLNQPTNHMKITRNLNSKIEQEASIISGQYIKTLEAGKEPATLRSIIDHNKYGILERISDGRVNMDDTLEKVRSQAHYNIKCELQLRTELANLLIGFREARKKQYELDAMNEQRSWKAPFALA